MDCGILSSLCARIFRQKVWSGIPCLLLHIKAKTLKTHMKVKENQVTIIGSSFRPHRLYSLWNSQNEILELGGLFPSPGPSSQGQTSLPLQVTLHQLKPGKPRTLEQVAYPFPSRSSRPIRQVLRL